MHCINKKTKKICNKEHATNGIILKIKQGFFIKRIRNLNDFYCKSILYYVIRWVQMFPFAKLLLKTANISKTRRDRHFKFRLKSDSTSKNIQLQLVFIVLFADARKTVSRDAIFRGIKSYRNRILSLRPTSLNVCQTQLQALLYSDEIHQVWQHHMHFFSKNPHQTVIN